jgi:hypothetical protein
LKNKPKIRDNTGFGHFLKEAWSVAVERAKIHRSLRLLNKQTWSVEFLTALLYKASRSYGTQLEMTITGPGGFALNVKTTDKNPTPYKDEDILQYLDDEVKVNQFVAMMQHRRTNDK